MYMSDAGCMCQRVWIVPEFYNISLDHNSPLFKILILAFRVLTTWVTAQVIINKVQVLDIYRDKSWWWIKGKGWKKNIHNHALLIFVPVIHTNIITFHLKLNLFIYIDKIIKTTCYSSTYIFRLFAISKYV